VTEHFKGEAMDLDLKEFWFRNFKSLYDTSFEPGRINVFIGANGSGKSTILEAIGLLSAAMTDRVDDSSLQRKGIRLSVPALYQSRFKNANSMKTAIDLSAQWKQETEGFQYDVSLAPPADAGYWKYRSEFVWQNGSKIWGKDNTCYHQTNSSSYIGFFLVDEDPVLNEGRRIAGYFKDYGIFQPNTLVLRGTSADPNQMSPVGLNGGRLAEALEDVIREEEGDIRFGSLYMDDVLEMIDWASEISIDVPKKTSLNSNIPTMRQIIEFKDRFMENKVKFTGYDASEGALYVLFMLCLAMHPHTPPIFAIDSFDHGLNPRLAKKITQVFCRQIIENQKHVFLTTHNPLVLDGLDLSNDLIRLFAVERSRNGYTQIRRIQVSEELIKEGQPLSRLWINGRLGGVPELL
jgi:predicted ATPase